MRAQLLENQRNMLVNTNLHVSASLEEKHSHQLEALEEKYKSKEEALKREAEHLKEENEQSKAHFESEKERLLGELATIAETSEKKIAATLGKQELEFEKQKRKIQKKLNQETNALKNSLEIEKLNYQNTKQSLQREIKQLEQALTEASARYNEADLTHLIVQLSNNLNLL